MSSNASAGALDLRPRRSRVLARWVLLVHAAALSTAVAVVLRDPRWWPLLAAVAVSLWWTWHSCLHGPYPNAVRRLAWHADGSWAVTDRRGRIWSARLLASSYVHPHLLALRFAAQGRHRHFHVILCRDSERAPVLRALRRRLAIARCRRPD